jgi:aryl-alcohol dehydrogenase-like predicted oxidoreductase
MKKTPVSPARRRALRAIAHGSAALVIGIAGWLRGTARGEGPARRELLNRRIPSSGELLPVIGLGTWRTFDIGTDPAERAPVREVLRRFVGQGGTLIDSSPMYGRAESVVGELAADLGVAQKLFYATKVWTTGREAGIRQMRQSFRRMRVARMDLMQVHNLLDLQTHRKTLRAWKKEGRVRYVGITHSQDHAHDALAGLIETREFDFVQLNYSLAEREAERRLLDLAADTGSAVLVNRPFAHGALFQRVRGQKLPGWCAEFDCTSWAQFFLKYLLAHPAVTCVIPATRNPDHLVDNMMAGTGRLPDAATRRKMAAWVDAL